MAGQEFENKVVLQLKDQLSEPLRKIRTNWRTFGREMRDFGRSASDLTGYLAKPVALLSGLGAFSLKGAVDSFAQFGDSVDKASQRAGVAAEALQKLRFAAKGGGMSADEMDAAIGKLTSNMAKAASGQNKDLAEMFSRLGISLRDSNGNVRSSADVMRNLAEAMKNNESAAARSQIATVAFGDKLGAKLIPVLSSGAEGLDAMGKKAEDLGIVMSDADVKAAAEFGDQLDELKSVAEGVKVSIGAKLAPVLYSLMKPLEEAILKNKELIATNVQQFVSEFAKEIAKIDWGKLIQGTFDALKAVSDFVQSIGGAKTILMIFGTLIGASFVTKVFAFVQAVVGLGSAFLGLSKAVGAALMLVGKFGMANPIIAGLTIAITLIWTFRKEIGEAIEWAIGKFRKLADFISGIGQSIKGFFSSGGTAVAAGVPAVSTEMRGVMRDSPGVVSRSQSDVRIRVESDKDTKTRVEQVQRAGDNNGSLVVEYGYGSD